MAKRKYTATLYAKPHGKDRPRLTKTRSGQPIVYTPVETKNFEAALFQAFYAQNPGFVTITGPVRMDVTAIYAPDPSDPDGERKARTGAPAYNARGKKSSSGGKLPDLDNVVKIVGDALQGKMAAMLDDTQVTEIAAHSIYGPYMALSVTVTEL